MEMTITYKVDQYELLKSWSTYSYVPTIGREGGVNRISVYRIVHA